MLPAAGPREVRQEVQMETTRRHRVRYGQPGLPPAVPGPGDGGQLGSSPLPAAA